jgi:hypothetical protein
MTTSSEAIMVFDTRACTLVPTQDLPKLADMVLMGHSRECGEVDLISTSVGLKDVTWRAQQPQEPGNWTLNNIIPWSKSSQRLDVQRTETRDDRER